MLKRSKSAVALILISSLFIFAACTKPIPEVVYERPILPAQEAEPFTFTPLDPSLLQKDGEVFFCIPKDDSLILLEEITRAENKILRLQEAYQ